MWYVLLLIGGLWGKCHAMDMVTVHKDDPDFSRGAVWVAAMTYHRRCLNTPSLPDDKKKLHTDCIAYLKNHQNTMLLARDNSLLLHGFENALIGIKVSSDGLFSPSCYQRIIKNSDPIKIDTTPVRFTACSVKEGENYSRVIAIDDNRTLYEWIYYAGKNFYTQHADTVPGTVTAIRQTLKAVQAVFFKEDKESGVGLLIDRDASHSFIPLRDTDNVTHINITNWYYALRKADGSQKIYYNTDEELHRAGAQPATRAPLPSSEFLRLVGEEEVQAAQNQVAWMYTYFMKLQELSQQQ